MFWIGIAILILAVTLDVVNIAISIYYASHKGGPSPVILVPIVMYALGSLLLVGAPGEVRWSIFGAGVMFHLLSWLPSAVYERRRRKLGR